MKALSRIFVVSILFGFASCDVPVKSNDIPEKLEKGRMVGVDTIHDLPINKDTIITRNFIDNSKSDWKNGRKSGMFLYLLFQLFSQLSRKTALLGIGDLRYRFFNNHNVLPSYGC